MRIAPAVRASFISLASAAAAADCWESYTEEVIVHTEHPTTFGDVIIQWSGKWPNGCSPREGRVRIEGSDIFLDVQAPDPLCKPAGPLFLLSPRLVSPGTNRLYGRIDDPPGCSPEYVLVQEITVEDGRLVISKRSFAVPEGGSAEFTVALRDPIGPVEVAVAVSGDPDIEVSTGSRLSFDDSSFSRPQTVTLAARQDGDDLDGTSIVEIGIPGSFGVRLEVAEADDERPRILHVDGRAAGSRSGLDWTNAFNDLQEALALARRFPGITREIRLAGGTYRPAPPGGGRSESFDLVEGVSLEGGYAGYQHGSQADQRHIRTYETILSGDLNGDDGADFTNRRDNSFRVVYGRGASASTVLDGLTITGSDAAGGIEWVGSMTVRNCILAYNRALYGGGTSVITGSPTFTNCVFLGNDADGDLHGGTGGGLWIGSSAAVTLLQCTFVGNSARKSGGGLFNESPDTRITNCIFWGNSAGGVQDEAAQVSATGGLFRNNDIQGWTGSLRGAGNFGDDPLLEDFYRLSPGSPCIEAGATGFEHEAHEIDIDGEPRLLGSRVDIGADEFFQVSSVFRRGQANGDGQLDISDAVTVLAYLFAGGELLPCEKAADANDDGEIDISDPISVLTLLFFGAEPLSAPYEECGEDPEPDDLSCHFYSGCGD